MTDLFGIKAGTPSVCAGLLEQVLEVRFRTFRHASVEWFLAENSERREALVLAANTVRGGEYLEPYAPGYEVLFFIERSNRQAEITRKLASETSFRFLDCSPQFRSVIEGALLPDGDSRVSDI